ncbi:mannose-binding protein [Streptomyces cyaneochromogenes]|uniref:Mannose-binding protein n=1 Tax=Streptomyces cyaneochromogenes TaxID=2496836 RepID=A0A3Q9EWV8_9ACTN|nr:mannose-binding protein [Streptomyces cyaneochromogenes]AZQ40861.1 mannose-binding protein [Streptomyces cyaneochromogenes]
MSPQHPTNGANAEAAAARVGEAGLPADPSAPDEAEPSRTPAPEAESGTTGSTSGSTASASGTTGSASGHSGSDSGTTEAESGTTGAEETTVTPSQSTPAAAAATPETSEERVAVAAAVGTTPPGVRTDTGVGSGRPRKPVLAGAAIAGAALIAIPLFLAGSAKDDGPPDSAKGLAAEGSDTVLNPTSAPAALEDYVASKPSPSPKKAKKSGPPKVTVPVPAAPEPKPSPSRTAESKPRAKPAPKPAATPKPNWSTETVYATSVLEVNQAWTTNRIRMVMQTDGNLVVYNEEGKPIWASMTFGQNHRAIFQQDGNLVIHNGEDQPIWASQTWGHEGAQLVLRADAKVVIVHNGAVVWST